MAWQIVGNERSVAFLKGQIESGKLRHAYLIAGPAGSGRRTLALAFIKALNCQNPPQQGEFCGHCPACRQIDAQSFADLTVLQPAEGTRDLRIDQIREMQKSLVLAPYLAQYRTVLIPDFQQATSAASNALLKSLEEPPARAVIILTANARESLLETIASRCETVRMSPLPVQAAQEALQQQFGIAAEEARLLAHMSAGRIGLAVQMAHDPDLLGRYQQALEQLRELLPASKRSRLSFVEGLLKKKASNREQFSWLITVWLPFWRDVLICASNAELPLIYTSYEADVRRAAGLVSLPEIRRIIHLHEDALDQIDGYVNPRLVMENLLLNLPRI